MAKISPVSIKYMIYANFEAEGPLEKPDVIGAIFGQTEGLLGSELEMRELQKEGKIGRIEVEINMVDGRTVGQIQLPSALDKSETTIIAATLETIDRIGPTEAKIEVSKIEDVRGNKRDYIIERAKKLLAGLDNSGDSEMSKALKDESRAAKIQEYGEERLPAGNLEGDEIIVVEGRADVVNLLKNRVNNVIGMDGAKLPKTIAKLAEEGKEITLFVDGDRGGKLIAKNVMDNARIEFIAVAPDGKEVEELTGKEILQALRKKVPAKDFFRKNSGDYTEEVNFEGDAKKELKEKFKEIEGTRQAILLNSSMNIVRKVSAMEVSGAVSRSREPIFAVVIDGSATKSIVEVCEENNVKHIAAKNFSATDTKINLISL